jgi:hypothetical protein
MSPSAVNLLRIVLPSEAPACEPLSSQHHEGRDIVRSIETLISAWRSLCAAALAGGLLLGPTTPAAAGICGDLADQCAIAEENLENSILNFANVFPLSEAACSKMQKGFFQHCVDAVEGAVDCVTGISDSLLKLGKIACKDSGGNPACSENFKIEHRQNVEGAEGAGEFEILCCAGASLDFLEICLEGL